MATSIKHRGWKLPADQSYLAALFNGTEAYRITASAVTIALATTMSGSTKLYFGDTNHWIARDVGATLSANALVYFHIKILGTAEYIFTNATLEMNANTITECGHITFNNGALLEQSANLLRIYGGFQAGDVLELIGSTSTSSPRIVITDGDRIAITGDIAITGGIQGVSGATVFNGTVALNDDVQVAITKKIQFKDTGSYIEKGATASWNFTSDGEIVFTHTNLYLNGANVRISAADKLEFRNANTYINSPTGNKLVISASSTARDAIKLVAAGGVAIQYFLKLIPVSTANGDEDGMVWYYSTGNELRCRINGADRKITTTAV